MKIEKNLLIIEKKYKKWIFISKRINEKQNIRRRWIRWGSQKNTDKNIKYGYDALNEEESESSGSSQSENEEEESDGEKEKKDK